MPSKSSPSLFLLCLCFAIRGFAEESGPIVLYDFAAASGDVVYDRSGVGQPIDLKIDNPKMVQRRVGSLEVTGKTLIRSERKPDKVREAVGKSGEISIEVWIKPDNTRQEGPARILTISRNSSERNLTLGQEKDRLDVRLRSSKTSKNGMPSVSSGSGQVTTKLTHVVYTRNRDGKARIFVNGKRNVEKQVSGDLRNWDGNFQLALANELSKDRPWLGTFYRVAVYSRELEGPEIVNRFKAGPTSEIDEGQLVNRGPDPGAELFEHQIAPLLSQHCLECHDSGIRKGKLDLSRKAMALAGGKGGPALVPGNLEKSAIWQEIEHDDMPDERDPLSSEEKQLIKEWILAGAPWTLETIDPAIYEHDGASGQVWVQRLTRDEYIETVQHTVGVDIRQEALELLPPDVRTDGFANTAYNLNVDLKHVDAYAQLAGIIVRQMDVAGFVAKFGRSRSMEDRPMRPLLENMGRLLLRGPVESFELNAFRGIATTVSAAGGDFDEAMSYVLEAMLQSPRFIYRIENQRSGGMVDDFELASRLSYIVWGGPPDQALLVSAQNGELTDSATLSSQVERMLKSPRAIRQSRQFVSQWLDLDRLNHLQPNAKMFPKWSAELAADMQNETLAFFEEIVWKQNRPLADLLNAQVTFASGRLARHYGLESQGAELARYELASIPARGGLLTQGSILTIGGDEASMVTRGLFVLHDLLRGSVKEPPPGLNVAPVPTKEGLTHRNVAEQRIANVSCGGCHARFEPLAFGLEKFDGIGAYHEKDHHGNPLRDDGEILFPGAESPVSYETSAELMDLLAKSDRVRESLTWKLTQFALGRPLTVDDAKIVQQIHETAQKSGGTYSAVITAIVMSDLVRMSRVESS